MNNSDEEQLSDILIGEAVFSLLREKVGISRKAILIKLQNMLKSEQDPERVSTILRAIQNVKSEKTQSESSRIDGCKSAATLSIESYDHDNTTRH
ncbi:hypothetical protein HX773_24330 [Pantoea sp. B9002]|uniref:hypothetical protein n=1 Tax=Pantoea sp. B9002 TaxID=2726979 RepID=UPI0015A2F3E9|nr:hypothetical protein [Pantoea sp. B9002]NWA64030.1 hypothetical protein [Pantoea sp. B9002]